ncbi:MAG: hypothetical protein O7C59_02730 [Rickettsia endosymbiont of Ixodes persulcatus]|nr:hypothetical protein [Rickettsia endosymbiont of Ixodes persulcatus]MCZ6913502.1 hypothetical protein [Rickettsia endosymbiont of Ixodes persulcatus]
MQFTWEAAQVLPDLAGELNNLRNAKSAAGSVQVLLKPVAK